MAKIKLTKDGITIYVDVNAVAAHELLGWKTIPEAKIAAGMLSLNGVPVIALGIVSNPPAGCFKITNVYVNTDGKFSVEWNDTPQEG